MNKYIFLVIIHILIVKSQNNLPVKFEDFSQETDNLFEFDRIKREGLLQKNDQVGCGEQKFVRPTITGGKYTERGEFPWKAALVEKTNQFFCGGTLVSNNMVVTAAHCVKGKRNIHDFKPEDMLVLLGVYDISRTNEKGKITSNVKAIRVHPDWNIHVDSYDADIAVLILETQIQFNRYIRPVCLDGQHSVIVQASSGITVGFGKTETSVISNIAKKLELPIIDHHKCSQSDDIFQYILSSRTFCGGYGNGSGVCEGDSGSGLFVVHNDRYYLRGITSASAANNVNECDTNKLSLFTDASDYCGWIRSGGLTKYAVCIEEELPTNNAKNILYKGECLKVNEYLESYNKCFKVVFQSDGQLVHYQTSSMSESWRSEGTGSCVNKACMQDDGNFVVSDCNKNQIFATNTAGNPGSRIILQNDGNFVLYSFKNIALWSTSTVAQCDRTDVEHESLRNPTAIATKPIKNTLNAGECLAPNEYLESKDKCFKAIYQADGDFVLYKKTVLDDYEWCTHTPSCANKLCMLNDGNLVLYDCKNKILFSSETSGNPGSHLIMADSGRLLIYSKSNRIIWYSYNSASHC
ncbi:uncharacterized protein [Chironomus tepperi]|uniref:uncharacterized protein n=1 Tax=Chironomus tepperi TaxID=113505 RepID=UPI00391FC073